MKKEHPLPAEPHYGLSDQFADSSAVQWISQNGKQLFYLLLALVACAFLYAKFANRSGGSAADYTAAETAYNKFIQEKDPQARDQALDQLSALLKKYPELLPKYEGGLAQTLLLRGNLTLAAAYAQGIIKRTEVDHLELFNQYSKTSLLIGAEKWDDALKQAQELKAQLEKTPTSNIDGREFAQTLYLFNLIRIAMLQQTLKQTGEEMKTWQAFKEAPVSKTAPYPVDSDIYEQVVSQLGEGEANLLSYIDSRLLLKVN